MLLWVMGVGFEWAYGHMNGYIRLSTLAVEHSVMVMTSQSRRSQIESYEEAIIVPHFVKFVRTSGGIKF